MILTLEYSKFLNIAEASKLVKGGTVVYDSGFIAGCVGGAIFKSLPTTTIDGGNIRLCFDAKAITSFIKESNTNNITEVRIGCRLLNEFVYVPEVVLCDTNPELSIQLYGADQINYIMNTHFACSSLITSNTLKSTVYQGLNLANQAFIDMLALKTAMGAVWFKIDNYMMTLSSNMFPVNKGDIVDLVIYEDGNTFISVFTVTKKKKVKIDIMARWMMMK